MSTNNENKLNEVELEVNELEVHEFKGLESHNPLYIAFIMAFVLILFGYCVNNWVNSVEVEYMNNVTIQETQEVEIEVKGIE